jgi:hypothetical protein
MSYAAINQQFFKAISRVDYCRARMVKATNPFMREGWRAAMYAADADAQNLGDKRWLAEMREARS